MNKIESYIASVIPKNIPKSKQQKLRAELEAHIFDRIDFYTEIGYDNEASINKALADMGEDEEIKTSIRNDFEELHFERTWWAALSGFIVVVINSLLKIKAISLRSYDPTSMEIMASFTMIFAVIALIFFLYKKGLRKSLIGVAIANILVALFSLMKFYPYYAVYALVNDVIYLLDKYTPLVFREFAIYGVRGEFLVGLALFVLLITASCFALSHKIKRFGKPQKKRPAAIIILCIVYFALALFATFLTENANQYFEQYPDWFSDMGDTVNVKNEMLADMFDENTTAAEADEILKSYGYITTEEYATQLDEPTAEIFRHRISQLDFFFNEDYQIWFNPVDRATAFDGLDGNGFLYLLIGNDGKIKSKGYGNGFEDIFTAYADKATDMSKIYSDFRSLEIGDDESDVLFGFWQSNAELYTSFTTYTDDGIKTYYRFCCRSITHIPELPGTLFFKNDCEVYLEFEFFDGKLTQGRLHYKSYDDMSIIPTLFTGEAEHRVMTIVE